MIITYLDSLIGKVYKILPLREDAGYGDMESFYKYVEGLSVELIGAYKNFDELKNYAEYIAIVNIVQFLTENPIPIYKCKTQVFKMINLIEKLKENFED